MALALLVAALVVAATTSDALHRAILRGVEAAEQVIAAHAVLGAFVFVVLAALSAMLAFFSSTILVPVAIETWGESVTALLLWTGWVLGGACAYAIGRFLGRGVAEALASKETLARYEDRVSQRTPFGVVVLFQIALPSEVPGYVLGTARYGLARYLVVQALVEIPWAVGTTWLGSGFLDQDLAKMMVLGLVAVLVSVVAARALRARLGRGDQPRPHARRPSHA